MVVQRVDEDEEAGSGVGVQLPAALANLVGFVEPGIESLADERVATGERVDEVGETLDDVREMLDLVGGGSGGGFDVSEPGAQRLAVQAALVLFLFIYDGTVCLCDRVVFLPELSLRLRLPFGMLLQRRGVV